MYTQTTNFIEIAKHLQEIVFITSPDTQRTMFIVRGQIVDNILNVTYNKFNNIFHDDDPHTEQS